MITYYKGYQLKNEDDDISGDHLAIFKVYDEPQAWRFGLGGGKDKTYTVVAEFVDDSGIMRYETVEDCQKKFFMQREITHEEYRYYECLHVMMVEMYNRDITGGFPRYESIDIAYRALRKSIAMMGKLDGARWWGVKVNDHLTV